MSYKRFQLRNSRGQEVVGTDTLREMLNVLYKAINVTLIRQCEVYRDNIFIASGAEIDSFFSDIEHDR